MVRRRRRILTEVAKMPEDAGGSGGAAARAKKECASTYIPPLFRLPPGMAEMEVVDVLSDGDD